MTGGPIAIVGMAGAFAGSAKLADYWDNILAEADCVRDVPATHWSLADYYDPSPDARDRTYSRRGGFLPEIPFDPLEFGLPPAILEQTDVAQLLALVFARQALADAGYGAHNPLAATTGVILGACGLQLVTPLACRLQHPIWRRALRAAGVPEARIEDAVERMGRAYVAWREDAFPGYLSNVVAGRIANRLDLGGINCTVDAACAASLASVQMAAHELVSGRCDLMLAGGVDVNNSPLAYVSFSKTPALTAADHMRPFDREADGMLLGEGVGILALRRLADAERDGNKIYAVLRGIGASSDGRHRSIYAPRAEGQELALRRAYADAGVSPASVTLLEAHGTGTATGDPTELAALRRVFAGDGAAPRSVAIGTVKAQIGHTKVAAGAAGLLKAALALHEKVLPATLHVHTPNPAFDAESPFYVNTRGRPWFAAGPRRAGVSAFGFGGTNFHAVLEEHRPEKPGGTRLHATPYAVFLAAPEPGDLVARCRAAAAALAADASGAAWAERVRASKQDPIPGEHARVGFVAASAAEAATRMALAADALAADPERAAGALARGVHYRRRAADRDGGVVALFPGQGAQFPDMGRTLCLHFAEVHAAFEGMDAALRANGAAPITRDVYPPPAFTDAEREEQARALRATDRAQPAVGTLSLGVYRVLAACGFAPDAVAGHSLGELSAARVAGSLDDDAFFALLHARGTAMATPPEPGFDPGGLLAVEGDLDVVRRALAARPELTAANHNSPTQLVIAGPLPALDALAADLAGAGLVARRLPVAAAFHSPRVAHAQAPLARALAGVPVAAPRLPLSSNVTAARVPTDPDALRALLVEQVARPVRFAEQIEAIYAEGGRVFVECGPGGALTGLVRAILGDRPHLAVATQPSRSRDADLQLREAYVQLRVAGLALGDLDPRQALPAVAPDAGPCVVGLTGAPYESAGTRAARAAALAEPAAAAPPGEAPSTPPARAAPAPPAGPAPADAAPAPPAAAPARAARSAPPSFAPSPTGTRMHTPSPTSLPLPADDATAHAHLQFLALQAEWTARYAEMLQPFERLAGLEASRPGTVAAYERALALFHQQQLAAQQAHAAFLAREAAAPAPRAADPRPAPASVAPAPAYVPPAPAYVPPAPAYVAPAPAYAPPTPAFVALPATPPPAADEADERPVVRLDAAEIAALLLEVISERTGYPLQTLSPTLDLEADLGVDSLKRVEIMAALEDRLASSLAGLDFARFAELRTVEQVAEHLAAAADEAA